MVSNTSSYDAQRDRTRRWVGSSQPKAERLHEVAARPWPHAAGVTLLILWVVGVIGFVVLAVAAHANPSFPFDRRISSWVQHLQGQRETSTLNTIGDLAGPFAAAIEYVIILGALLLFRLFREAICAAVSGLGAELLNIIVNGLVKRPRPPTYHGHVVAGLGAHSFPSGHTADAVGLYGFLIFLAVLAARAYPRWRPWLAAAIILCVYFIADIGVSRVIEGQHWPTDVLAGYLLGALTLIIGVTLYHRLSERAVADVSRDATGRRPATGIPATS
ncbi:MAG TPA: phosphatase PAP2 family protein [Ktedonobacterales bacterium]